MLTVAETAAQLGLAPSTLMTIPWKASGFTQRKPREPGVYFIRTDGHLPQAPARRLREHWEIAEIIYFAGSYTNASDNSEQGAHWRVKTLDGLSYRWSRGMWIKGPIHPVEVPTT